MLIQKFLDYLLLEKNYSTHTVLAYKTDLFSFKDFCEITYNQSDLETVHYNQIRSWIVSLVNQGISNRTINRKVSSLKTFYKFLMKVDLIEVNPLQKHQSLKASKKMQVPFTVDEVINVIENIEVQDFPSVRDKLIVELFYSTGIRRTELINIKEYDVDLSNNLIKVLGKRDKERFVPLLQSVKNTLILYLDLKKKSGFNLEYLLLTNKGAKIYETLVYRIINLYFSQVSTKVKKSPHILRHTFATHLLNEGANLNSVKELLGHSSLASTQVYTHNSLEQIKKMYNKAHPRSNKND